MNKNKDFVNDKMLSEGHEIARELCKVKQAYEKLLLLEIKDKEEFKECFEKLYRKIVYIMTRYYDNRIYKKQGEDNGC